MLYDAFQRYIISITIEEPVPMSSSAECPLSISTNGDQLVRKPGGEQ